MKSSGVSSNTSASGGGLCSSKGSKYRAADETTLTTNGTGQQHQQHTINLTSSSKYNDDSLLIKDGKEKIELKNIKTNVNPSSAFTNLSSDYQIKINLVDNNHPGGAAAAANGQSAAATAASGRSSGSARRCWCACTRAQCTKESAKQTRKKIKRPLPCLFAWSLLIGTSGAYFVLVAPCLLNKVLNKDLVSWTGVVSLQIVVLAYVVLNFLIAIFRDPGRFQKIVIPPDDPTFNDDNKCPLYRSITIKKASVKTKWCSTCNFYRPPRCSHCSICDACIDSFDHHCPWLNNCVGKRNYRFFFQFLGFLVLHMVGVFFACLAVILHERPLNSVTAIAAFSLMGLIAVLILPIAGLFSFHIVLISNGRTTNEHVTGKYRGQNFFSRGFVVNFIYLFCGSLTPQLKPVRIDRERLKQMRKSESKSSSENGGEGEGALKHEEAAVANKSAEISGAAKKAALLSQVDKTPGAVLVNNRASGAVALANAADEGQHLKSSYSQNSLTRKENGRRLQEQDLLELVLKNKREKAALKSGQSQSRPTSSSSSSSPNESFRSNSVLDDTANNSTTPRAHHALQTTTTPARQ